ncbi:MAG TPA: phosphatidylserine decarboxylase family protein [Thermoplasmata archaeon]|jgi:phosphatidylserine decarboxylase|nr:MAG TPA: phosphatidylserine decarboxylase family protein [Thermoplasmata archaeon]
MRVAKGCWSWVAPPLLGSVLFSALVIWFSPWFLIGAIPMICVLVFFLIFFRDPERKIGDGVIAPADGEIRDIKKEKDQVLISTFMEVNNVHVNRMPIAGRIIKMTHFPGYHLRAWKKESDLNERVVITIDTSIGQVTVVQLAGLIARRVYPYIKDGDVLKKGDRIGIIRLGSRVDVYLPAEKIKSINVKIGDPVRAGEDTIAFLKEE